MLQLEGLPYFPFPENVACALAQMMHEHPEIGEFDIHPLILYAKGDGAAVADRRMVIGRDGSGTSG